MDFNDHGNVSDEPVPSKQRLKLRRSCELCRNIKGRCVPCPNDSDRCLKCVKDGKQCVFLEAKPRPKRAKNSRIRVAEMEEKLEGLLAILASNQAVKDTPVSAPPPPLPVAQDQPSTLMPEIHTIGPGIAYATPSASSTQSDQSFPQQYPVFSYPVFDDFQDSISKGFITASQAEDSLRIFRSKASTFPFVVIPPKVSLDSLRRQRPFLFLAILCCATEYNSKLQLQLELELRENLSRRVLVSGEKSLDILQGVLVYITWYHFYFSPSREQIYQLCQMAVAMVVDLGIDKPTHHVQVPMTSFDVSSIMPFMRHGKPSGGELEAMRTFLGCYYLISSTCQGLRKPQNLKYCDYMKVCAQSLAEASPIESDHLIPYLIRVRQLSEEVNQAFDYDSNLQLPKLDSVRTEILAKAFEQQLDQIQSTIPQEAWSNAQLTLSFHHLRIYVNEVGFHAAAPNEADIFSGQSTANLWYHSAARNDSLMRCLHATKSYLDRFLSLPDSALVDLVMLDLLQLVYAVLILGSFSSRCDAPTLDSLELRQTANLEFYLKSISDRILNLIALQDPAANRYYRHMHTLFQQSRVWYIQMITDPSPTGPPNFFFMDIIRTITGRCADFSTTTALSESSEEDKWTEMLSEWTSSIDTSATFNIGSLNQMYT